MNSFKETLIGFICFLFTIAFNVGLGIIVYTQIENKSKLLIAIIIFIVIIFSAIICSIIDYIRRKIMIGKPLKEILHATELMARGNFNIQLIPIHSYQEYDEFDLIKYDLNKMAKELSKNEMLKNDFISNVSHEIKTPISVIQSYAKALQSDSLEENTRKKYLLNLQESCKKISNLVTNILKINKLENQKLMPSINKFNLSESLTNQILQYEELIEEKNIKLECDIEENVYINSEESYLELIWNNLINNAIKFSKQNGKIEIKGYKENNLIKISIKDHGIGIKEENLPYIFNKFYQGDTSHASEGNGLGLSLVKGIVDLIDARIEVNSKENEGSEFIVTLKA